MNTPEPLTLQHKHSLSKLFGAMSAPVSEYSFANLYLFRKRHDYAVLPGDEIFITGAAYNGDRFIMPTRDVRALSPGLLETMIVAGGMLYPVLEEWLPTFPPDRYDISYDASESDYLHSVEKLATYAGNRLHSKKTCSINLSDGTPAGRFR
jgi:uncharacterized protein